LRSARRWMIQLSSASAGQDQACRFLDLERCAPPAGDGDLRRRSSGGDFGHSTRRRYSR
jgi:hypothetical protein